MEKSKFIPTVLFLLLLSGSPAALAQKANVQPAEKIIQKIPRRGLQIEVTQEAKRVEEAWEDYLRKHGRVESSRHGFSMETAKITSLSEKPIRIISTVEDVKGRSTIFCAFDLGTSYITRESPQYREAEAFMSQFARHLFEEERDAQIKEAEKELAEALRQQEKRKHEGENLLRNQERNRNEKASLECKLEENRQEADKLVKEVETNKKEQLIASQEADKKRRSLEEVKAKYALQ